MLHRQILGRRELRLSADAPSTPVRQAGTVTEVANRATVSARPLDAEELRLLDAYWRAANYLSVGQIYLLDNPLLRRPLELSDVKPRLLGHWGTTPASTSSTRT